MPGDCVSFNRNVKARNAPTEFLYAEAHTEDCVCSISCMYIQYCERQEVSTFFRNFLEDAAGGHKGPGSRREADR